MSHEIVVAYTRVVRLMKGQDTDITLGCTLVYIIADIMKLCQKPFSGRVDEEASTFCLQNVLVAANGGMAHNAIYTKV